MNQDQRELLELAAYAIGGIYCGDGTLRTEVSGWNNWVEWNPLADKADAFDLMVKLNMEVTQERVWVPNGEYSHGSPNGESVLYEDYSGFEAVNPKMLAITRAAAAIGKQMKGNGE